MKRFFCLFLAIVMALCATPALATSATYDSTKAFVAALDEAGIKYTIYGIDDDDDIVTIRNTDDNDYSTLYILAFTEDNESCYIRAYNLIEFNASNSSNVINVVNNLNCKYRYAKFYVDSSDNTVTCSMDVILRSTSDVGEIVLEAILHMVNIIEKAHSDLKPYEK